MYIHACRNVTPSYALNGYHVSNIDEVSWEIFIILVFVVLTNIKTFINRAVMNTHISEKCTWLGCVFCGQVAGRFSCP